MRVLITSDIHIDDYRLYNVSHRSRLNQFYILLEKIQEVQRSYNIDTIFLLGDILNKPSNRPYVTKVASDFIGGLCKSFKDVYYILGQHDIDQKNVVIESEHSIVNIFPNYLPNLHYVHDQYIQFGNRLAYFSNFSFKKEVSVPTRKVDAFFSHVTLPIGMIKGQVLDDSNFDLGVFGDIHAHIRVGKSHSVGTPIQVGRTEVQTHTLGIWDTDDNSFVRIPINEDGRLSKILPTSDKDQVGPRGNDYYYYKAPKVKVDVENKVVEIDPELDINKVIEDVVKESGLQDVHEMVIKKSNYIPIDFNFKPIEMEVRNIRSCQYFHYEFREGVTFVNGPVGSGKSTVLNCILDTLLGTVNLKDRLLKGTSEGMMSLTLAYGGHIHKIIRHSHMMDEYYVDGNKIQGNNQRVIESEIRGNLPFIDYTDSFFFGAWTKEILGSLKSQRRVELLSKYHQLDVSQEYLNIGLSYLTELESAKKSKETDILRCQTELETLQRSISDIQIDESQVNSRITEIEEEIRKSQDIQNKKVRYNTVRQQIKHFESLWVDKTPLPDLQVQRNSYQTFIDTESQLRDLERELNVVSQLKIETHCHTCGSPLDPEKVSKLQSDQSTKINQLGIKIDSLKSKLPQSDWKSQLRELDQEISRLTLAKDYSEEIKKLKEEEHNLQSIDLIELPDILQLSTELSNLKSQVNIWKRSQTSLHAVENLSKRISEEEVMITQLNQYISKVTEYCNLLKFDGPIVTSLLEKITSRMSNENFQFNTLSYKKNGKSYADLSVKLNVDGEWMSYEDCSTGQKCLCDTYFLSKLITYSGMVMFDEFFSSIDDGTLDQVFELIRSINSNYIIICSHSNNITDVDHVISVSRESRISKYTIS